MKYSMVVLLVLVITTPNVSSEVTWGVAPDETVTLYLVQGYHYIESSIGIFEQYGATFGTIIGIDEFGVPIYSESVNITEGSFFNVTFTKFNDEIENVEVTVSNGTLSAQSILSASCCSDLIISTDWDLHRVELELFQGEVSTDSSTELTIIEDDEQFGMIYRSEAIVQSETSEITVFRYFHTLYDKTTGIVDLLYKNDEIDGYNSGGEYYESRILQITGDESEHYATPNRASKSEFKIHGFGLAHAILVPLLAVYLKTSRLRK